MKFSVVLLVCFMAIVLPYASAVPVEDNTDDLEPRYLTHPASAPRAPEVYNGKVLGSSRNIDSESISYAVSDSEEYEYDYGPEERRLTYPSGATWAAEIVPEVYNGIFGSSRNAELIRNSMNDNRVGGSRPKRDVDMFSTALALVDPGNVRSQKVCTALMNFVRTFQKEINGGFNDLGSFKTPFESFIQEMDKIVKIVSDYLPCK